MKIPLSVNQSAALQEDIREINQIQRLYDEKVLAHQRHRNTIILDAGGKPSPDDTYRLEAIDGTTHLVVIPKE